MDRIKNAWAALCGKPVCTQLPPIKLLEINQGDRFVFECEGELSMNDREIVRERLESWLEHDSQRVAVLPGGVKIVAVRRSDA